MENICYFETSKGAGWIVRIPVKELMAKRAENEFVRFDAMYQVLAQRSKIQGGPIQKVLVSLNEPHFYEIAIQRNEVYIASKDIIFIGVPVESESIIGQINGVEERIKGISQMEAAKEEETKKGVII